MTLQSSYLINSKDTLFTTMNSYKHNYIIRNPQPSGRSDIRQTRDVMKEGDTTDEQLSEY